MRWIVVLLLVVVLCVTVAFWLELVAPNLEAETV